MASVKLKPIVLYDISCATVGRPWSPHTIKTRYCLGYKGLPFTTVWIELRDIPNLFRSKGITQPPHTLPAIDDPNTGAFTVDSLAIAAYLDETYPETPKVLSPAVRPLLEELETIMSLVPRGATGTGADTHVGSGVLAPRLVFVVLGTEVLDPANKTYYHQMRTTRLGELWTSVYSAYAASPEGRAECVRQGIDSLRGAWDEVAEMYDPEGVSAGGRSGREFILGDKPCLVDFAIAGRIKFISHALLPSEMDTVRSLGGGRLHRMAESLERYFIY